MEKNEVDGKIKQARGKAEEEIGKLKGDKAMEINGKAEQIVGKAQETIGKAQGDAIKATKKYRDLVSPEDIDLILSNIEEEEVQLSNRRNSAGGFGVGLLVGAAVGVSLALLFAPYSGQKTRRLLKEDAKDAWEAGAEQIRESRELVNDMMENARERADSVVARAKCRAATE